MGIIRTLLAISVVLGHSYGFVFTGGRLSVQIFYIISGYLMSLVLSTNEKYKNVLIFYFNRFLRLYPIYWVVALITLMFFILKLILGYDSFFEVYEGIDFLGKIALIFSNLLIVGQDWIMFTGVFDGVLGFTTDFSKSDILVYRGLLVPQAWTLGVEISFYLIVPFIINKKRLWGLILILSLILRLILVSDGIGLKDPFSYRFFPTELSLFLFGVFSQQILLPLYKKNNLIKIKHVNLITFFIIMFILFFHTIPLSYPILSLILIIIVVFSLPFISKFQKKYSIDNWISKLSYPIYISHMLIIYVLSSLYSYYELDRNYFYYSLIILLTCIFSLLLELFVNKKIEEKRF